jgi:hypothetical protein
MITQDQRATLQLLLERGQTYADLAALLGEDETAVRARARAALTELVGEDPDSNVGLTDYLLGQADPIGRADASRHLRDDPDDLRIATELAVRLRLMFPTAELPKLPGEGRPAGGRLRRAAPSRGATAPSSGKSLGSRLGFGGLDQSQSRLIAICGGGAVLLIVIVLAITGAFSGGDDSSASSSSDTSASTTTTADSGDNALQTVALKPVGGGDATGTATFGLATGDQPYVDLSIKGLDPAPNGQAYVVWLMLTDTKGYPLSPLTGISQDGGYQNRFSIPSAVLPVIARVQFVDVSIAPVKTIRKLVRDAINNTELVIDEPGTTVLRGAIPKSGQGAAGGGSAGGSASGSGNSGG